MRWIDISKKEPPINVVLLIRIDRYSKKIKDKLLGHDIIKAVYFEHDIQQPIVWASGLGWDDNDIPTVKFLNLGKNEKISYWIKLDDIKYPAGKIPDEEINNRFDIIDIR